MRGRLIALGRTLVVLFVAFGFSRAAWAAARAAEPQQSLTKTPQNSDQKQPEAAHSAKKTGKPETLAAVSIGSPTAGKLRGAAQLTEQEGLDLRNPERARWGLPELTGLLSRSARRVRQRYPGSVLLVGDLSHQRGGPIDGHLSHESGRDADVGFYFVDAQGKPRPAEQFLKVEDNGKGAQNRRSGLKFDERRNWALVQAWLTDPHVRVQHIFVAQPLRARLLRYARQRGVYLPVLHRAAMALKQPTRGLSHDDHFHVRIACPSGQHDTCVAEPRARRPRHASPKTKIHNNIRRKIALSRAPHRRPRS